MHCLSLQLLFLTRQHGLSSKLHYLLYHALYLYQNDWAVKPTISGSLGALTKKSESSPKKASSGQTSLLKMGFTKLVPKRIPTAEQNRIINHPLNLGPESPDLVKIVAFAGTGKTTTLIRLTEAHPNIKFLLVVYNKSVRIQAESQFPKANVTCKTVHQMAMAKCGFMFAKKLTGNLKAKDILESDLLMERGDREDSSYYQRSGQVLETLNSFMNSPDMELSLEHVPCQWRAGSSVSTLPTPHRAMVLEDSLTVWAAMADKEDMRIRMPHDGYLKEGAWNNFFLNKEPL